MRRWLDNAGDASLAGVFMVIMAAVLILVAGFALCRILWALFMLRLQEGDRDYLLTYRLEYHRRVRWARPLLLVSVVLLLLIGIWS